MHKQTVLSPLLTIKWMQRGTNKLTHDFKLFIIAKRTRRVALHAPTQALSLSLSLWHSLSLSNFTWQPQHIFEHSVGAFWAPKTATTATAAVNSQDTERERVREGKGGQAGRHMQFRKGLAPWQIVETLQFSCRLVPNSCSFCLANFAFDSFFRLLYLLDSVVCHTSYACFLITDDYVIHLSPVCACSPYLSLSLSKSCHISRVFPNCKKIYQRWHDLVRLGWGCGRGGGEEGGLHTEWVCVYALACSYFLLCLSFVRFAPFGVHASCFVCFLIASQNWIFFLSRALSKHVNISIYFCGVSVIMWSLKGAGNRYIHRIGRWREVALLLRDLWWGNWNVFCQVEGFLQPIYRSTTPQSLRYFATYSSL